MAIETARKGPEEASDEASRAADSRNGAGGGVPEVFERRVLFESASEVLGGLGIETVVLKTANKGQCEVSAAADSRFGTGGGVLDGGEGGVRLQEVGDDAGTLYLQVVVAQTANEGGSGCQRLLTVGTRVGGGALEVLES